VTPPRQRRIDSANDELQLVLSLLHNRKQRRRQGRFVVQGVAAINQALAHGWSFESLWIAQGRTLSRWARDVLERAGARAYVELEPELFVELSGKTEPGELVAVLDLPPDDLGRIAGASLVVVCDRPASPGNLGSIVRTADAFGADGVVVTGHAADVYDPQTVRASLGALFATPVVTAGSPREVAAWLRGRALRIVGTSAKAESPLDACDFRMPAALVVGNETAGLSEAWRELCDEVVSIPIRGATSSLNVAAAAAIFLAEVDRQRRG
jgi:tRNA G18 (ribose-2'-O)-methylase SpoU